MTTVDGEGTRTKKHSLSTTATDHSKVNGLTGVQDGRDVLQESLLLTGGVREEEHRGLPLESRGLGKPCSNIIINNKVK